MPDGTAIGWTVAQPGAQVNLGVGGLYFGGKAQSVRTLLGSCVALTLWHPQAALSGMCHFVLPTRVRTAGELPDGRYGDEALDLLVAALLRAGTRPADYVTGLYGGADVLEQHVSAPAYFAIGPRNIAQGWSLARRHGLTVHASDLGDRCPRTVRLWNADGRIDLHRGAPVGTIPPAPAPLGTVTATLRAS